MAFKRLKKRVILREGWQERNKYAPRFYGFKSAKKRAISLESWQGRLKLLTR
jgi:hypothetical protein